MFILPLIHSRVYAPAQRRTHTKYEFAKKMAYFEAAIVSFFLAEIFYRVLFHLFNKFTQRVTNVLFVFIFKSVASQSYVNHAVEINFLNKFTKNP